MTQLDLDSAETPAAPTVVSFIVDGQVVPWQRTGGRGRRFTPPRTRRYQSLVATLAACSRPRRWPRDARYRVTIDLFHGDRRRRDTDNCAKTILDALQGRHGSAGVLFEDDDQVAELVVRKHIDRAEPRAEITVEIVE